MNPVIIWADEWYPVVGGLEKALHKTANALVEYGIPVMVLTRKDGRDRTYLRYRVVEVDEFQFIDSIRGVFEDIEIQGKVIIYCARLFKKNELEQLRQIERIRQRSIIILRIPSTWSRTRYSGIAYQLLLSSLVDHFICLNQISYKILSRRFPSRSISLVYNTSCPANFNNPYIRRKNFMWGGRFTPSKNVFNLAKAWQILFVQNEISNDRLFLFGGKYCNNEYRLKLTQMVSGIGNLEIAGMYDPENINHLSQFRFILLPSYREGCPNLLVESFAAGTPVIGADVPGVAEHIAEGRGVLIKRPFNPDNIAHAIKQALSINENEYCSMQENIRKYHSQYFTTEFVASIIREIYVNDYMLANNSSKYETISAHY